MVGKGTDYVDSHIAASPYNFWRCMTLHVHIRMLLQGTHIAGVTTGGGGSQSTRYFPSDEGLMHSSHRLRPSTASKTGEKQVTVAETRISTKETHGFSPDNSTCLSWLKMGTALPHTPYPILRQPVRR